MSDPSTRSNAFYFIADSCTFKRTGRDSDGDEDDAESGFMLCNFAAWITTEIRFQDGVNKETFLTIEGVKDGTPLPPVTVNAEKFNALGWVTTEWGVSCVIRAGSGVKDDLRTAIQMFSTDVQRETVYRHTGWVDDDDTTSPLYLTANGAITPDGFTDSTRVELPAELSKYRLTLPTDDNAAREAFNAAMSMLNLGTPDVSYVCLGATLRACIAPADFGVHITGRSGTFKSEIASLYQSFYGSEMDARNLPASWSSTANALEAIAYRAKNALMVVDDFIPVGTSWQVRQYNKTADQLIRGQGNQAGRARLTDTSSLQRTMYPRGLIFSTGEDTPEGLSLRGRLMIIELSKGDISAEVLSDCQSRRELLPQFMADFILWQCHNRDQALTVLSDVRAMTRDEHLDTGHTRTPQMIGDLCGAFAVMTNYAVDRGFMKQDDADAVYETAERSIVLRASDQTSYLTESDPATQFINSLGTCLAAKMCHFANMNGGLPEHPESFGWVDKGRTVEYVNYQPQGMLIGWVDLLEGVAYLNADTAYDYIKKHSGGNVSVTRSTLWKRLKEAGMLDRVDDTRQRNTIRQTVAKSVKTCVALNLSQIFQAPADDDDDDFDTF